MTLKIFKAMVMIGAMAFTIDCTKLSKENKDYPIKPVPFNLVKIKDEFWAPRIEKNRTVTIPFALKQNEETGRVDNFAIAGGLMKGEYKGERYNDTDVYKVLEGASYSLALHPDPELDKYLDTLIEKINAAQEDDGYLFTPRTANPDHPRPGIGEERWSNLAVSHELYNAGHLYEAAVTHYQATGKRNFLDIALKNADLIASVFGPDKRHDAPGHQEIEMGLVKLFRVTKNEAYLNLAKFFLDQRGRELKLKLYPTKSRFAIYNDPVQIQAHKPVLEQNEAVGHAVRATYMYSGMADVAALTGDSSYVEAIDRLWDNVVGKKMYLTGGLGAKHSGESFGENYELPNLTAYNETCAAIGNVFWNHRLFLLHGDTKYLDVLERVLYNGVISGVSLEGNTFFYPNPLESDGKYAFNKGKASRQPWFGVACCPGNIARFIPSVPGYVYAHRKDVLYVNLFVASAAAVKMNGQTVSIKQATRYPWEGEITIIINPERSREFAVFIRIPGWAQNQPVPTDLYRYIDTEAEVPVLKVNGEAVPLELERGFARIRRKWKAGDVIELSLPMPIRRVLSHPDVKENEDKVALERGPVVYCAEWVDNNGRTLNLVLPDEAELRAEYNENFLNGMALIRGKALASEPGASGKSPTFKEQNFTAIPYYAWAHRGEGEMSVWLPRTVSK